MKKTTNHRTTDEEIAAIAERACHEYMNRAGKTAVPDDTEVAAGKPTKVSADDEPSTAFPGRVRVWLAGGLLCPDCGRKLHATDVVVDDYFGGVIKLICSGSGCHHDVLIVGIAE